MRITLLGTGSADGWPNPFCDCASCEAERRAGRVRRPSAALVDGRVLIDSGPTAPYACGVSLRDVEHLLVTHGHPDHLNPALLLTRSWAGPSTPLHVWGPRRAIDSCRQWLGPEAPVQLHTIEAADAIRLRVDGGEYQVRALPAEHHHGDGDVMAIEALLYVVTDSDGHRLLYMTDTGPLPPATIAMIGGHVDAVLLDETFGDFADHGQGHLDLAALPGVLTALRNAGVIDATTLLAATHLGHHNPPTSVLRDRLATEGVVVPDDLDVLDTRVPGGRAATRTLVLGGTRSGKSTRAEQLAASHRCVQYIATGGERHDDAEWAARVAMHRARRPVSWITHETTDVAGALRTAQPGDCVLVDCLTLWLTAQLDGIDAWARLDRGERDDVRAEIESVIDDLVGSLRACTATVILVSNEVGMDVVAGSPSVRAFVDLMGRLNTRVADACDNVELMVAGRVMMRSSERVGGSA